jgi:hypothetical protein
MKATLIYSTDGRRLQGEFDPMKKSLFKKTLLLAFTAMAFLLPLAIPTTAVFAVVCSPAGTTTLTAAMVVTSSHTTISGTTINAAGCDLGIYVSPGLNHIVINQVTVTGANQHGIFVQDDSYVTIENSLLTGNGVATRACPPSGTPPPGCIPENKPIELVGTSHSLVTKNVVDYNTADGGIGIADDGAQNPGAPLGISGAIKASTNDVISWNTIDDNTVGCGIVIAVYNPGVGVNHVTATHNTIIGSSPAEVAAKAPVYIGQIVVATDGPSAIIKNVKVTYNSLDGSFLPGIVLHANVFGDKILNTQISWNTLANNGYYPGPPNPSSNTPTSSQGTVGISIVAENPPPAGMPAAVVSHTTVSSNTVLNDNIGLWLCYTDHTTVTNLMGNPTTPQTTCVAGGT